MEYVYLFGEILLILALLGMVGVIIWLVMTALRAKTVAVTNAGRLYKRPLNASKNLITTVKGLAQQETVRAKHVAASVKEAVGAVKEAATEIKTAAQGSILKNYNLRSRRFQNAGRFMSLVAQFSQSVAKQEPTR